MLREHSPESDDQVTTHSRIDGESVRFGTGWISGVIGILFGFVGLAGVLCLRFPDSLTMPELRPYYPLATVRALLHVVLVASFLLGVKSICLRPKWILGSTAIGMTLIAALLGGSQASLVGNVDREGPFLGLDWFLLNLLVWSAVFIPLERMFALRQDQPIFRHGWRTDLVYFFVSSLIIQITTIATLKPAEILFGWTVDSNWRSAIGSQPVLLQLLEIMLITDLVQYWLHRAFHRIPFLWRFHSIHHSTERMDWLAGSRLHIIDVLVTRSLTYIPLFALGFSELALVLYAIVVTIQATFIHANVRFLFGPLRYAVVTPQFHHWHHSDQLEAIDKNFAVHLPIWDMLFGSFYLPGRRWPSSYGVTGIRPPAGYWNQMIFPFKSTEGADRSSFFQPLAFFKSLSFSGLVFAATLFALSLTPSLLPRTFVVQGILSGVALAVGYGLGAGFRQLVRYLEIPVPTGLSATITKSVLAVASAILVFNFVGRIPYWQNSIRELMEMPLIESAYVLETVLIALVTGFVWIAISRSLYRACGFVARWLKRLVPPRVAYVLGTILVLGGLFVIGNGVVWRVLLRAADSFFLQADRYVGEGIDPPTYSLATGSPESRIGWEQIGRQGKNYLLNGPTKESIEAFLGREAKRPIRVYAGMNSGETPTERAELALQELIRVGAFDRSLMVIATPTGTGWLDPGAVDTLEYLHAGDCATVTTQYSYLPSWIAITVDPRKSVESAHALFDVVYGHWKTLPRDARPKLYLHGLSLGALGGEVSADLYTVLEDPIHGAVWSGPPFPSRVWNGLTRNRRPESPAWLPEFRDGRLVRFTSQYNTLMNGRPWGPIRTVYIQYASDPMTFFSPSLIYKKPAWLAERRGPDVSPYLAWYPLITFLQIACDLPMATSIPHGYGHNFAPAHYIDAWIAVTEPKDWKAEDTKRLKEYFLDAE